MTARSIAVLGAGTIGQSFALLFARAGFSVVLWDPDPAAGERACRAIELRLNHLNAEGFFPEPPDAVLPRIRVAPRLHEALAGACLIQEAAPEILELKQRLFAEVGEQSPPDAILATSSSAIPASQIASSMTQAAERLLVAHPGNPPHLIPVIELVPHPGTDAEVVTRARALYSSAGLAPVVLRREIEGFLFNRLQGALLREAYCLFRDGVASVDDIDQVVRMGLGLRWAVIGPFEVADLNVGGGLDEHARRLGAAYARMGAERGQSDPWTDDLVAAAEAERRSLVPKAQVADRIAWRDRRMAAVRLALNGTE